MAALALLGDGMAYGVTGRDGKTELRCFDPGTEICTLMGAVQDDEGNTPYQIHHIVSASDDTLYAGENDNPYRTENEREYTQLIKPD